MHQFVWARALCGIRYGCPAAVNCSGTIQKINMEKPEWSRVTSMHGNVMGFMIRKRLTSIWGHFRAQGSALTRNVSSSHGSKHLLQRAISHRHESGQGRLQMSKSYGFSLISRDASIRLGSRLLWYQIWVSCCCGLQRDHPENPYEKD